MSAPDRSIRREVGSQFVIGLPGPEIDASTRELLETVRPGGVILFARNLKSPEQVSEFNRSLRSMLGRDLLLCIDHEGGRVNRMVDFLGKIPSAQQITFLKDPEIAREHGHWCGRVLKFLGFNLNLAPVVDLLLKPNTDNSVPDRCWGRTAPEVITLAGAFLEGMQAERVLGSAKHFPGYGGVDQDPHLVLPKIERSARELYQEDMLPYKELAKPSRKAPARQLHCIMISHAHVAAFDRKTTPALLSPFVVQKVLRRRLRFGGVIISDDLEMGAIIRTMPLERATAQTLANGVDLPLICHTPDKIVSAFEASVKALEKKKIQASTLRACRARIRAFKARFPAAPKFDAEKWRRIVEGNAEFTQRVLAALPEEAKNLNLAFRPVGESYLPKYD
ncbi:MAG: glycoside hydrolase family 3 protein [Verrucomicrobiae bacterium]|nr:glycoside hydrolase family 3 protein [Verrucomicrobiae bacterium]